MLSFQEWCTDPCDMGLCIIMLKHEVMVDERHKKKKIGPKNLIMVHYTT